MCVVIESFEEAEGRNPGQTSIEDLPKVLKLRKEVCEAHVMNYFVNYEYVDYNKMLEILLVLNSALAVIKRV